MANHGVIIRELPSHDPVNYRSAVCANDLDNGYVVSLTALKEGERELWLADDTPAAGDELWLVTGVEHLYEETKHLVDYYNEAGKAFRVERCRDMICAISKEALTIGTEATDMVAGAVVVAGTTKKLTLKASAANGDVVIGRVAEVFTRGGIKFASIEFAHEPKTASVG